MRREGEKRGRRDRENERTQTWEDLSWKERRGTRGGEEERKKERKRERGQKMANEDRCELINKRSTKAFWRKHNGRLEKHT